MSERRGRTQSEEWTALRQEVTSLRQEIAALPPAVGAELAEGLKPVEQLGTTLAPPDAGGPGPGREARPGVGPALGAGSTASRQADDPGADVAGSDAAGVERGDGGYSGGRGPDDGPGGRDADVGAVAEEPTSVTRWRERIAAAREEAQEQERAEAQQRERERERARQERKEARQRERERERARERDEDLEWER